MLAWLAYFLALAMQGAIDNAPFAFRLRGNGEVVKREEFEQRKAAAQAARIARLNKKPSRLASQGKDLSKFPLLQVCRVR